jgi:phosphate transport system permease protein
VKLIKKLKRLNGPSIVFLILALIPLAMLVFVIVNLFVQSMPAMTQIGFFGYGKLFSSEIENITLNGVEYYGLLPAIWGTVLVILVTMVIAFPVSLAIAIFANEFDLGFLGDILRSAIGIFAGIPAIIYALVAVVFARLFIIPKFCGVGYPGTIPPPGMTWFYPGILPFNTSTLLGGIMLSFIIIPFLTPLLDDAIRDVPRSLKEASFALGANRWYTVRHVILPYASPGILSAGSLATLASMGDVVIVGMVIGFQSLLPDPLFDILKSTAPLTSTGAGFEGGFSQSQGTPLRAAAADFTGLLLLVIAFAFIVGVQLLQRRLRRRYDL